MLKTCSKCGIEKPFEEFYKSKRGLHGVHGPCKVCYKQYNEKYYSNNKDKVLKRTAKQRQDFKVWYQNLKWHNCVDCKQKFPPWCMQFDHAPSEEKLFNISMNRNKMAVLEEIKKCDLVCANCHATRTYIRANDL